MFKSASQAVTKWTQNTAIAGESYKKGASETSKDQSAAAIAAKPIYISQLQASFAKDSYAKGLQKSGKGGWIKGIVEKGAANFATGVSSAGAQNKYVTESSKFDQARKAADALPRGVKGSATNLNRVTAVVNALRAVKTQ